LVEEKWVRYWFRQILAGLSHINSTRHSHLDIKCENIMLDKDLNIKIADFTFAQRNDTGISGGIFGSEFYRAPEICRKQCPYDGEKADVFALAIVLFACAMKRFPTLRYKWIINTQNIRSFAKTIRITLGHSYPRCLMISKTYSQACSRRTLRTVSASRQSVSTLGSLLKTCQAKMN
jgi:serine/threonine protein kinase